MQTIERIPLACLDIDPINARQDHPGEGHAAIQVLADSMAAVGQLQPILVRPAAQEGHYLVSIGWRRCLAARALDWTDINAVRLGEDATLAAVSSAAENIARQQMHPVDMWLAIARLCDQHGWDLLVAARAIGLDPLVAPRMRYLAQMDPSMLAHIRASPAFPSMPQLRAMAAASHATQRQALAGRGSTEPITQWDRIAGACKTHRISRALAIFDHAAMAWDEDMLAQPDDPDRYTTEDATQFLAHQRAALDEQAKRSKGRVAVVAVNEYGRIVLPDGWMRAWGDVPKRFNKGDERRVFKALAESGERVGEVIAVMGMPEPLRAAPARDSTAKLPRPPITKAAQRLIALKQAEGVHNALDDFFESSTAPALQALLGVFVLDNVNIDRGMHELMGTLHGILQAENPSINTLLAGVRAVIERALIFPAPDVFHGSGCHAHDFAHMVGAVPPRCDTADILRGVSLSELQTIAQAHGMTTHGTATALRKRLVGHAPHWRPAEYGAPAPSQDNTAANDDDADDTEAAE